MVDNVVWVGQDDPLTATAPLRGDQVADRLLTVFPDLRLLPREQRCGDGASCSTGASIGGASCDPGWPLQMWETNEDQVPRILVFPSAAALRETQANLTANGWLGMGRDRSPCTVSHDPAFASDWIDVENVLIEVDVAASGATPAQQKLIDEIRTSLSARP